MGLLDKVPGLSSLSEKVSSSLSTSPSFHSVAGIEGKTDGTVHSGPDLSEGRGRGSKMVDSKWYDDEDGTSPVSLVIRGLQTFLPFVNVCIYIALAAFQSKWNVGVSFLVGLSLFFNAEALLYGAVLLAVVVAADNLKFLRGLERAMRQVRVAVIVNSFQSLCMILLATITTVSANVGGCKRADKDPHADLEGYVDALPTFCRNKRAGAAFFWLTAITWLSALALTLIAFVQIRRNPRSTAFIPPSSTFPDDHEASHAPPSAHDPFSDSLSLEGGRLEGYDGGYRPSHDYAEGAERLFDGRVQGYDTYHHDNASKVSLTGGGGGVARDPFEDQYDATAGGAIGVQDPYEAIKQSMEVNARRQGYSGGPRP